MKISIFSAITAITVLALPAMSGASECKGFHFLEEEWEASESFWQDSSRDEIRTCLEKLGYDNLSPDGSQPLQLAAYFSSDIEIVKMILEMGSDVTYVSTESGRSVLHDAASGKASPETLRLLIAEGSEVDVADSNGMTPLYHGAFSSTAAKIQILIDAGADTNAVTNSGHTALLAAAEHNERPAVVRTLVAAGAKIDVQEKEKGDFPLRLAIIHNSFPVVKALIDEGANLELEAHDGTRVLSMAVMRNRERIFEFLINEGADPNFYHGDDAHYSALRQAYDSYSYGRLKFSNLLKVIQSGTDLNAAYPGEQTILVEALDRGKFEVASALIDAGADVSIDSGERGVQPTHAIAALLGNYRRNTDPELLDKLLNAGAQLNATDSSDLLAVISYSGGGDSKVLSKLIRAGANVNVADRDGNTLFIKVVQRVDEPGYIGVMHMLLAKGVDAEKADDFANTPLHIAFRDMKVEVVKALVDHGVNLNPKNRLGLTPVSFLRFTTKDRGSPEARQAEKKFLEGISSFLDFR